MDSKVIFVLKLTFTTIWLNNLFFVYYNACITVHDTVEPVLKTTCV